MGNCSRIILLLTTLLVSGCARLPVESITLSDTVGKDLAVLHIAHINLVRQYFSLMSDNINAFVDDEYRPFIISQTITELNLIEELKNATTDSSELDPLDIMEVYTEEVINQIENFRRELLAPIDQHENTVLSDLELTYTMMRNANATITAHLRSVRGVHEVQSRLLGELGLPTDLRERISTSVAGISQELNRILSEARADDGVIENLPDKIKKIMKQEERTNDRK